MQLLTLVILILRSKLAALVLVLASDINGSVCNCLFFPTGMDIIQSQKKPQHLIILGSCVLSGYCPVEGRDVGSICMPRKCHYVPDLGKNGVYVLDSL